MNRATLAEIILGFGSVAVAMFAVIAGFVTIGGWLWFKRSIQKTAGESAQQAAEEQTRKFLSGTDIRNMLEKAVAKEASALYSDMDRSPMHEVDDLVQVQEEKEKND